MYYFKTDRKLNTFTQRTNVDVAAAWTELHIYYVLL